MALMFSNSGEDAINRVNKLTVPVNSEVFGIDEFYEIRRCAWWINRTQRKKVALQFPDYLLKDASEVILQIRRRVWHPVELYVLGDTSYGSCCLDEVATQHVNASSIIHFGHSCLSSNNRLRVLYVFGKLPLDIDDFKYKFKEIFVDKEANVLVFCDVFYFYIMEKLKEALIGEYKNLAFSEVNVLGLYDADKRVQDSEVAVTRNGRSVYIPKSKPLSSYQAFYIGSESPTLMSLMLSYSCCKFSSYDPKTRLVRQETLDISKYFRKRCYYIEKIKDAKIIGILIGTLAVRNYLKIISHLQKLAKISGKKAYTLVIGKLNAAKLANFPEIDVFVYVSCTECSLINSRDFYQPIVTPFDMELALNQAREWTGNYYADYSELLISGSAHVPLKEKQEEIVDVSLITGKLRSLGNKMEQETGKSSSDVLMRDSMTVASIHEGAAGEHLAGLSWKGLEPRLGETPVSAVVQGKHGIAAAYKDEGMNIG